MKIAVIDVGSNTVKFDLYDTAPTLSLLLNRTLTVGLARFVENGNMTKRGTAALCSALSDFSKSLDLFGCETRIAVATASLRGIGNADEVVSTVLEKTGIAITVLPGTEEAKISYESVRDSVPDCPAKGMTVDMGGGSTDVICFDGEDFAAASMAFGSLRLREAFVKDIRPTAWEMRKIRRFARGEAEKLLCPEGCGETVLLVGGTSKAIGNLLCEKAGIPFENGVRFPVGALDELEKEYRRPDAGAIGSLIRFAPERLHTLIPGLSAHQAICRAVGCKTVVFTTASLRDGIIRRFMKGEWKA